MSGMRDTPVGVIKRVSLKNFMHYKHLTVDLGPNGKYVVVSRGVARVLGYGSAQFCVWSETYSCVWFAIVLSGMSSYGRW